MDDEAARDARAEALFRGANERIAAKRDELGLDGPTPFVCECRRPDCTAIVRIVEDEYERIRAAGNRFVVAPGHQHGLPETDVLEERELYVVIEKRGERGRITSELDARTPGEAA